MFYALKDSLKTDISLRSLQTNILAGLTVGVIALPLSMALAIASGVAPQFGLYTAIIAGIVIALSGGSRVNISGPTAAFVVVLLPIVQTWGLGGLLFSGFMAGVILLAMGLARMGRLIEVVPYPVTVGFTAGIGVVIATLQIKDFLGLPMGTPSGHYFEKIQQIIHALPGFRWPELLVGVITLAVLLLWPRLKNRMPSHLVALLVGSLVAAGLSHWLGDFSVDTIGLRFHWQVGELRGSGIPPVAPTFMWPWERPGADGQPLGFSFALVHGLAGAAFTIAMLGAIESLLCAVVADGMSGKKHDPNDELIGQGLGNLIAPLFGGIPATAAIARTAANVRAGGTSPLSSVVHSLFILAAMLLFARYLNLIPMASMAALLLVVAWNMSEVRHFARILKIAPRDDVITLLTCFTLTVVFDMVIAVGVGMGLAAMLFIRRSIQLTSVSQPVAVSPEDDPETPHEITIYHIDGPLFFGTAQKALKNIMRINPDVRCVILDMSKVTMLDMSAIIMMESIVKSFQKRHMGLVIHNLQPRMILKLRRAGLRMKHGEIEYARTMEEALGLAKKELAALGEGA